MPEPGSNRYDHELARQRHHFEEQGKSDDEADRLARRSMQDRARMAGPATDSERAGGLEPLRFVGDGRHVVLGLVSTKTPELENGDELRRRLDEAARYVPLDRLSLSPQCGFASTSPGNPLTPADQEAKLRLVVETAERVWG